MGGFGLVIGSRVNSSPPVKIPDYVRVHELAKPYRKLMFWIQFDDIVTGRPALYDYDQEGLPTIEEFRLAS